MINPVYVGAITIGLLHGLEPGHGWPVALLYSVRKRNSLLCAAMSSSIIGIMHLVSSIAVVVAYVLLQTWLDFEAPWLKYVAAALLLILAYRLFREKPNGLKNQHGHMHEDQPEIEHEHEHEHPGEGLHSHEHKHVTGVMLSLWGLASFAFLLGFAHEEEFALLAFLTGDVNPWMLMLSYGVAVLLGLIAITVASVKLYKKIQPKLIRYERYVLKIGAVTLLAMAIILIVY